MFSSSKKIVAFILNLEGMLLQCYKRECDGGSLNATKIKWLLLDTGDLSVKAGRNWQSNCI